MSRHSAGACFDNSLDSSHDHRYASHDASDVAQTVAASSVIAPWSEYNTRVYIIEAYTKCLMVTTQ
jgi:hypothetical protein